MTNNNIYEIGKEKFPALLREINDPPDKLFVRGDIPPDESKFLCVVGSRKYSDYGRISCEKFISGLRGYNVVIVSGLANGIDSIAHKAALETGLRTVAVPGSGLDFKVLHPASNKRLAEQIIESGSCLISEFEPNFKATHWSFPQRNRLMAGMSHAVLVIEAELKSGTLITSKLATHYNRDVFALPGSIFSKNSEGPHMLIRLGATPITKVSDLILALGFKQGQGELPFEEKYKNCSAEELKIIEILCEPLSRDELIRASGLEIREAITLISIMELKGLIEERLGEVYLV